VKTPGVISGVRVTYRTASVGDIATAGSDDQRTDLEALLSAPTVEEAFVLRTCNRAEAYVVASDAETGREVLEEFVADVPEGAVVETGHEESLRHLLRVAAGLESMVLGEDRILGQVREAYEDARGAGGIGPVLEEGVTKAIHVGERVRSETGINEGAVSIASAATRFVAEDVDLESSTALVVGAGDIATAAAKSLAARDLDRLVVANRTIPNAEGVADAVDVDAEGVGLDAIPGVLDDAAVVATATGSQDPVVEASSLSVAGETVVVDMGQPRDVDPAAAGLDTVELYDLDALEAVTEAAREQRRAAAERAETTLDREFDHLLEQYKRKRADEVIAAMHESAEAVKERELETAIAKLESSGELTDDQREVVESLADALVGQLLAAPTKSLRDAAAEDDWATIATALQLFDPEFRDGSASPPSGVDAPSLPPEASGASSEER
jgi:glutamyl-tRNA reductase